MDLSAVDGLNRYCPQSLNDEYGPNESKLREWKHDTNSINSLAYIKNNISESTNYAEEANRIRKQFSHYFNN